jgi:arsenical pump membrane protein
MPLGWVRSHSRYLGGRLMLIPMWAALAVGGIFAVATGWVPGADARHVALGRGGPVLVFLVAVTVLAELAQRAGVFDAAADACARLAGGSTRRLFLLIAVLGTVTTAVLSLDTTAVLLTPVVLTLTLRLGLRPLPFALLAVWLANAASLLLPMSNLTNLLAHQRTGLSSVEFARRMALPEIAAVAITVAYLWFLFRRDLSGRYERSPLARPSDVWTFRLCSVACIAILPCVLAGWAPWEAATLAAGAAVAVFAMRRRSALSWDLIPWRLVVLVEGLFLLMTGLSRHGLTDVLSRLSGHSTLRTEAVAAAASNAVNNLPAYLAVEPAVPAGHTTQLLGALLGTNAGPLILVWGSLATLLWRERCRAYGVRISPGRFAAIGLGSVPLIVVTTWFALTLTG